MKPGEGLDKDLTDWEAFNSLRDEDIDLSDIPELDKNFWKHVKVVQPDTTRQVTLRVKQSVLEYFKAGGKGYQTRMNQVLESFVKSRQ